MWSPGAQIKPLYICTIEAAAAQAWQYTSTWQIIHVNILSFILTVHSQINTSCFT